MDSAPGAASRPGGVSAPSGVSGVNGVSGRPQGGRGARLRILQAAARLFYEEGINATGMERLVQEAHVSRRTFYQHFPSKNALVEEYLACFEEQRSPGSGGVLENRELSARQRLLGLFADPVGPPGREPLRGCAFHNAAVEMAGTMPSIRETVIQYKERFTRRLTDIAREAGAADPEALGRQLAVLYEGAGALITSLDATHPMADARAAASVLIDAAIGQDT